MLVFVHRIAKNPAGEQPPAAHNNRSGTSEGRGQTEMSERENMSVQVEINDAKMRNDTTILSESMIPSLTAFLLAFLVCVYVGMRESIFACKYIPEGRMRLERWQKTGNSTLQIMCVCRIAPRVIADKEFMTLLQSLERHSKGLFGLY